MMEEIFALIRQERAAQDAKWGANRRQSASMWLTILVEEVGEVAKAILERDLGALVHELVQVAAVTVATLEAIYDGRTSQF